MAADGKFLGRGGYGKVYKEGSFAVKKYERDDNHEKKDLTQDLIQEVAILQFLSGSSYVVCYVSHDIYNLEVRLRLYHSSLRVAMREDRLSKKDKIKIFCDVLHGVGDVHSIRCIHGDLKPSNILIDINPCRAVICDFGLASRRGYAKTKCTTEDYSLPDDYVIHDNYEYHDLFGMAIIGAEMFSTYEAEERDPSKLRHIIVSKKSIPRRIRNVLVEFTREDSEVFPSAAAGLKYLTGEDCGIVYGDPYPSNPIVIKPVLDRVYSLSKKYNIRHARRGCDLLCLYIESNRIKEQEYEIHILALLVMLSSIFGESGFKIKSAMKVGGDRFEANDVKHVIDAMLSDTRVIRYLMHDEGRN
jgi:serine/threonine protein kinase